MLLYLLVLCFSIPVSFFTRRNYTSFRAKCKGQTAKNFFEFLDFADFLMKEAQRFIDFSKLTDYN